jgi:ankyrin repeat protein
MKAIYYWFLLLAALVSHGSSSHAAESTQSNLEKGLFQEEGNHDLAAAKKNYRAVLEEYDKERKLAAVALFHLAQCLRKEGNTNEAAQYYNRLVSDFADQTNLVNSARTVFGVNPTVAANPNKQNSHSFDLDLNSDEHQQLEIDQLAKLFKENPDLVNATDEGPETRLQEAVKSGRHLVAKFLISKGADVNLHNPDTRSPLMLAIEKSDVNMASLLVSSNANINDGALSYAVQKGSKEIVDLLLRKGANPNSMAGRSEPLNVAAELGFRAIAEELINAKADLNGGDHDGNTPLHLAAMRGYLAFTELLVSKGASQAVKNKEGLTPFLCACKYQQLAVAEFLGSHGADVMAVDNAKDSALHLALAAKPVDEDLLRYVLQLRLPISAINAWGLSPLWLALITEQANELESVLNAGANPKEVFKGHKPLPGQQASYIKIRTKRGIPIEEVQVPVPEGNPVPILFITERGQVEMLKLLLAHGADPNQKDDFGRLPLENALHSGRGLPVVKLLLEYHASVNAKSYEDQTALDQAETMARWSSESAPQYEEIASILRAHGAIENLPRLNSICFVQPGQNLQVLFSRRTNDPSRYTLLESIVEANGRRLLDFPDFAKVFIGTHKGDNKPRLVLNLYEGLTNQQCDANILLQWGDVVSIPKYVPASNAAATQWPGFPLSIFSGLTNCLGREIELRFGDKVEKLLIDVRGRPNYRNTAGAWDIDPFNPRLSKFRNVLQSGSSLKRIHITRKSPQDSASTSFDLDLSNPESPNWNFWLRDGDVLEEQK